MAVGRLGLLVSSERRRSAIVTLFWGLGTAFTFAQGILQRARVTLFEYALVLVMCLIAGAVLIEIVRAFFSFLSAMALGIVVLLAILVIPATEAGLPPPGDIIMENLWISVVFTTFFPFPILIFLVATFIGAFIGDKYF